MFIGNNYITEGEQAFYNFINFNSEIENISNNYKYGILNHPNMTNFKVVHRKHTNFINHFEKKKNNNPIEFPLHLIHIAKPKINIEKLDSFNLIKTKNSDSTIYYINMISSLLNINDTESIKKLKEFNGDIYNTILFG